jgi:hypothetical protein
MIVPDPGRGVDTPLPPLRALSGPPVWLPVVADAIPRELTQARAWYPAAIKPKVGKVGQWDKIPSDPQTGKRAQWSDPATRCTFGTAFMAYESGRFEGVGYMMHADAGVIGIDLDKCVAPHGSIAPWASEIVASFPGAYWERSVSGTGLRGFCKGTLPVGGCRSKVEGCSVELYADVRFLVVTGHAITYAETLPELQPAVDALHARLTSGRVRAAGTAVASGLTGRLDSVSPEAMPILEDVMGSRFGSRYLDIWGRDDLHVAGASEDDWALENEIAYQALRRGYEGDALHQLVEQIMRAGPYRAKWDEPGGAVTWLAQDVANAVATTEKRLKDRKEKYPDSQAGNAPEDASDDLAPSDETPEQTIARLRHKLAQARTLVAQQQPIIRHERAERQAAVETVRRIGDVLAIPTERLAPAAKILTIVTLMEAHSRASRGQGKLPAVVLEERSGLSTNTVSAFMQDFAARDGSPISRRKTREWVTDDLGGQQPITVSLVAPRFETVNESLAAVLAMGGPSEKAASKAAAKRTRETERERRRIPFGHCSACNNDTVSVKGTCPQHGEIVGETVVRREDFEILNPNRRDSGSGGATVDVRTKGHNRRDSAPVMQAPLPPEILNHAAHDSGPTPIRPGVERPAPWRCRCGSMERYPRGAGGWRCDGCGDMTLPAVSGGAE